MSMSSTISATPAWVLTGQSGPSSLEYVSEFRLPLLEPGDVLVRLLAASLNYRELAIARGKFGLSLATPIVPSSDGAGEVLQVGSSVKGLKPGDKVVTHLTVHQDDNAPATFADIAAGLGHGAHGALRKYAVFHESSLVKMPNTLSFREAATLTCSGLTAWNALFGPGLARARVRDAGKALEGKYVLVQGSGGVSVAALQFALAAGATVIATTSSNPKAEKLSTLGAHHIINYRTTPNWGEVAKSLTPNNRGVDIVVDVGGPSTVSQSLKAVTTDGLVALTGLLGAPEDAQVPSIMDGLTYLCTTSFDDRIFSFEELKEAYEYLEQQRHFSKVVIDIE
ncbi:GroES-like protein [Parathielavia appendiculata]|uniref:GroES-like protein n=1 Tax=Parathielavia appendiculata TaxID=2587402 RepID=A0AAN6U589_9PEZI|nr:GroES-like protein [Parathielavia appendiculata]